MRYKLTLVFITIGLASCDQAPDPKVAQLQSELAKYKAKEEDKPSRNDVLPVAREFATATTGSIEVKIGSSANPGSFPIIEVTDVTIKASSTEGSVCQVIADVQVRYLSGFSRATLV